MQKSFVTLKNRSTFVAAFVKSIESVAQQVEHIPFKDGVLGSSPSWFTEVAEIFCYFFIVCRRR